MPYSRLFSDAIEVEVNWSNPVALKELRTGLVDESFGYLYKIVGRYNGKYKLWYIGKTFSQTVSRRLGNIDHMLRCDDLKLARPKHEILVSIGSIKAAVTAQSLAHVENLLIYAHSNSDFPDLTNKRNTRKHNVAGEFCVNNTGFRKDHMYREVALTIYYRK
jgi:hypothetical protein